MKILILTNKLPYPARDGGSIATLNLALGLQSVGNQIDILAINTSKHFFPVDNIPIEISEKINIFDVYADTTINPVCLFINLLFSKKAYNAIRFYFKKYQIKLIALLRNNEYDIIQLEGLYMAQYLNIIRKHSNAKIVMRSHNVEHKIWYRNAEIEKNLLRKFYLRILAKRIKKFEISTLNQFDALVPITDTDAKIFSEQGCNIPVKVLQTGIEIKNYSKYTKQNEITLFHIGALDWLPNLDGLKWFFENVWKELKTKYPDLSFHLAGRNCSKDFKKYFSNIKGVEYYGEVEDAKQFIHNHTIMIVPLFSGSGMRIKILEGMAMEKAIVATTIGAEGIPVTDNVNVLIADDKETFIEKINLILTKQDILINLMKNARQLVTKKFDTFTLSNDLINFYQTL